MVSCPFSERGSGLRWFSVPWSLPIRNAAAMSWLVYIVASLTASITVMRIQKRSFSGKERKIGEGGRGAHGAHANIRVELIVHNVFESP